MVMKADGVITPGNADFIVRLYQVELRGYSFPARGIKHVE
jgi:hypothetical protein